MIALAASGEITGASGVAARIEAILPAGVRARQLRVRTLLAGMCLAQADHRPAHLTRVHQALTALGEDDQWRLGVIADWKDGPHQLTCRQTERTFGLVADVLGKDEPDGLPSGPLQRVCDDLLEASIAEEFKNGSRSLAVDWTDMESFSRPPPARGGDCADPEAWWGHRKNNLLRSQDELFYGYYLSAGIMMRDEGGPAVMAKTRCPLRPSSMTLDRGRREILQPPENPQACRAQQTITVPPEVNAKTRQKHDYPSAAWRRSYARRTGAERGFATAKDPATNDIARGWCRLMGLAPLMLFTTTLLIVRNQRILAAWNARQQDNARRAAAGAPPETRKRRRRPLASLATGPP